MEILRTKLLMAGGSGDNGGGSIGGTNGDDEGWALLCYNTAAK